jgi:hypothetical protein
MAELKPEPEKSSRCGALLKTKKSQSSENRLCFGRAVGCLAVKRVQHVLEVAALDVDCGEISVVAMKGVMAWPGVAWWRCPVRAIASSFAVGS